MRFTISQQQTFVQEIITGIDEKKSFDRKEIECEVKELNSLIEFFESKIAVLKTNELNVKVEELNKKLVFLKHKEKYNVHYNKFVEFVERVIWVRKAQKAIFPKKKITIIEKDLSERYFNNEYVDIFNNECIKLDGNFGVVIKYSASAGKSYRQLKLKGTIPNSVLSEGEQKVIALADFITEMSLSTINRGIIFDDPVTSLDDIRKSTIARRLVEESTIRQVIVFTHDLVFLSSLLGQCNELGVNSSCHWVENRNNKPGQVWLENAPSYERVYRKSTVPRDFYSKAKDETDSPESRDLYIKQGFTALRTCYEVLVINDLFKNVVQRFNERVSVDALSKVKFDEAIISELLKSFGLCCRYMEGHSHSDLYGYVKPTKTNLLEEIERYEQLKKKIKALSK